VGPGTNGYGIRASSSVIGNFILGTDAISSGGGIRLAGNPNSVVVGNVVKNVNGTGLHCGSATNVCVSGNMFINDYLTGGVSDALAAITNFGDYSTVVGNVIQLYGVSTASRLVQSIASSHDIMISNNSFILCSGTPIDTQGSGRALISGNFMTGGADTGSLILNYGNESVIANNLAYQFGGAGTPMMVADGTVSGNGIISGNMIVGCGGDTIDCSGIGNHVIVGNTLIGARTCAGGLKNIGNSSLVVNNFIRDYAAGADGISVKGSNCSIIGNAVINQAGSAISVDGYDGTLISSNYISEPYTTGLEDDGYGIEFHFVNSGQIVGNVISQSSAVCSGIYLADSAGVNVNANYITGFYTGIWAAYGILNQICGNYVMQDPDTTGGYFGIRTSVGAQRTSIVGNTIYGSNAGVWLEANACLVSSNLITRYQDYGIYAYNTDASCIVGNRVGPVADTSTDATGVNLMGCDATLVVGNIAYGKGLGYGFIISAGLTGSELTMSGNISMEGNAPSDGSAFGVWLTPVSGAIDAGAGCATCIYIP
jgi:hypothetical protein